MRTNIVFIVLFLISTIGIKAQEAIIVSEDSLKIGNSLLPGLSVTIPEANYEKTLKAWVKDLRSGSKSKVVTDKDEMSIFGAKIKDISADPINVYSKLIRDDSGLKLYASFELKKDYYIERSGDEGEFVKAQNYLRNFSKDRYIEIVKEQADAEDKKLRDLQKKLSSLERETSRLQKSIRSDNSLIASEKANLPVQNDELTIVLASLDEQNELIASMEAGPAQKEKAQLIKDLKKRKKKAEKSLTSSKNKSKKANSAIDKATVNIRGNERAQNNVKEQIAIQKGVYQGYLDKIKVIKSY